MGCWVSRSFKRLGDEDGDEDGSNGIALAPIQGRATDTPLGKIILIHLLVHGNVRLDQEQQVATGGMLFRVETEWRLEIGKILQALCDQKIKKQREKPCLLKLLTEFLMEHCCLLPLDGTDLRELDLITRFKQRYMLTGPSLNAMLCLLLFVAAEQPAREWQELMDEQADFLYVRVGAEGGGDVVQLSERPPTSSSSSSHGKASYRKLSLLSSQLAEETDLALANTHRSNGRGGWSVIYSIYLDYLAQNTSCRVATNAQIFTQLYDDMCRLMQNPAQRAAVEEARARANHDLLGMAKPASVGLTELEQAQQAIADASPY
jgi:hypothetical protein